MLFLQYFMINLVLTKSSGPKRHTVAFTAPIFAGFCVYHTITQISVGGGGQMGQACTTERVSVHSKNASVYSPIVGFTDL